MSLLSSMLVLLVAADCQAAPESEPPTAPQVRAAVERSLPFLMEGGEAWRDGKAGGGQNGRICVTCHQIPFTLWSHNEAQQRGIKIDPARHDALTVWSLQWCSEQKSEKTNAHTGGFLSTMQQLIMGRNPAARDKLTLGTFELFEKVIGTMRQAEGWWKDGNQIKREGAEREANEVDTMWVILGLTSLEQLGDALPAETLQSSAKNRERALTWLKESKPGMRTDWVALRMLLDREYGEPKQVEEGLKQLLAQQNADGGWPLVKGEASHPLVTGQCLYALSVAGRTAEDPAIGRARKYLLDSQQENGSWKASSRREAEKFNVVTIHWGTGWATIGLLRTLPKDP